MIRELLNEVPQAPLDEAAGTRLRGVYERSRTELKDALSEDLQRELAGLAFPLDRTPSEPEIWVAQAQLAGWLEGPIHGIQAALWGAARGDPGPAERDAPPGATWGDPPTSESPRSPLPPGSICEGGGAPRPPGTAEPDGQRTRTSGTIDIPGASGNVGSGGSSKTILTGMR